MIKAKYIALAIILAMSTDTILNTKTTKMAENTNPSGKTDNKINTKNNINTENKINTKNNINKIKKDIEEHFENLHQEKFIKNSKHFIIESRELPKPLTLSSLNNQSEHSIKLI